MVNKLITRIAALGAAITMASATPALGETKYGVQLRWNLGGDKTPSIGLSVENVKHDDIESRIASSSVDTINSTYLGNFGGDDYYDANGTMDTTTTKNTRRLSDKFSGYGVDVQIPFKNWRKPVVEVTGIKGNENVLGRLGLGYDFGADKVTIPGSAESHNVVLGTSLRNPITGAYIALDSSSNLDDLDKTSASTSTTSAPLCVGGGWVSYNADTKTCF